MSNPRTEKEQLELETASLEHAVVMGEALNRLRKNPDFVTVIENGYLDEKVKASVSLLAVPQIVDAGKRGNIMEDIVSASNLMYFFQLVDAQYQGAISPILSDEEEDEILAEQVAEANAQLVN